MRARDPTAARRCADVFAEAILVHDPHVAAAIMFGRGRVQNGVLIEPKAEFAFDPKDEDRLAEFRNKVWCVLARVACRVGRDR